MEESIEIIITWLNNFLLACKDENRKKRKIILYDAIMSFKLVETILSLICTVNIKIETLYSLLNLLLHTLDDGNIII